MNPNYEQFYCRHCKQLFMGEKHEPYYMCDHFVDNFMRFVWSKTPKHTIKQPLAILNCPRCYSNKTVNVSDILSGKLIIRSEKLAESTDKRMLKCLGEWLKFYSEITGYHLLMVADRYILYTDEHNLKRNIKRSLAMKTKALNNNKNK